MAGIHPRIGCVVWDNVLRLSRRDPVSKIRYFGQRHYFRHWGRRSDNCNHPIRPQLYLGGQIHYWYTKFASATPEFTGLPRP